MSLHGRGGPPLISRWLLRRLLPGDAVEFVSGDLDEEYRRYAASTSGKRSGRLRAGLWYRSQAVRSLWQFLRQSHRHARRAPTPAPLQRLFFLRSPGDQFMSVLWQDTRLALRNLRRIPGFTLLVLLTLGVGIGATTAMFSAVNEVLLRPLSFAEPERLVMLWDKNELRGWEQVEASPANALDWRQRVTSFDDVALVLPWKTSAALETDGVAVAVDIGMASGNLFSVLGVPPLHGRTFTFEETWADAGPLVVLGHALWTRYFGADPSIVGTTIMLDGAAFEVIGVLGPDFRNTLNDAGLWTTFRWEPGMRDSVWFRQAHVTQAIARLKPGVSLEEARDELAAVGAQLRDEYPQLNLGMEPGLSGLQEYLVGDQRTPLFLLLGAVGLLQLIACANVANLLLVRANARRREMVVRTALGAQRSRLARLVLTEGAVLAVSGTAIGIAIGAAALRWIEALRPPEMPQLVFRLDLRLLAFTIAVTAASAVLFSLLPVFRTSRVRATRRLSVGARSVTPGASSLRAAGCLVSVEVALAVILVVGAGLMMRSLTWLSRVDSGVVTDNVLTFQVTPPSGLYPSDSDRETLAYRLIERLEALPGVRRAAAARGLPFTGYGWSSDFRIEGSEPDDFGIEVRHRAVTSGYFQTLGVPLIEGEIFDDLRAPDEAVPVVVNQAFVDAYFPGDTPVGRRVAFDRAPTQSSYWYPIVGVVGNERMLHTSAPRPEIISHFGGDTPGTMSFAVKTELPPHMLMETVRHTVAGVDARIPFVAPRTMDEVAADALIRERFLMKLLGVFAAAALLLAAVGVYGVAAQAAKVRTKEIGIRMALGATGDVIARQLVLRAALFIGAGVVLGLAAAAAGGRLIAGFLYGIEPFDPTTWLGVAVLLAAVGLFASYLPARVAARADPSRALYTE